MRRIGLRDWALRSALVASLAFGPIHCGPEEDDGTTSGSTVCTDMDTAHQVYSAGIEAVGEAQRFKVKIVDAMPAPPGRGDNTWTVQLLGTDGAPMPEATIVKVKPWMPDHGHGTNVQPEIGTIDQTGTVVISSLDFRMPGVWTVTIDVETAEGADSAVFAFCIDG